MARKFEYLVLAVYGANWVAGNGASGKFDQLKSRFSGADLHNLVPLLNTLGTQGWELTGVMSSSSMEYGKFVFKRELE